MTTTAGFSLPALTKEHKLHRILHSALGQTAASVRQNVTSPWNANFFGLAKSSLFTSATPVEQKQILQIASQGLLAESYFIEKAGIGYMSKMTLLAKSTEERMLYSLFSADETTHLAALMPFVSDQITETEAAEAPFLNLLESLLETASRSVLIFVIQVVLEGWGLNHYRTLSRSCCNPDLAQLFHSFLQAESRHHGAGVTLFKDSELSQRDRQTIIESLAAFLQMVKVGPQRLVEAASQVKGGLTRAQKIQLLEDLNTEAHSGTRLNILKSLVVPIAPDIADALHAKDLFSPLLPAQCV